MIVYINSDTCNWHLNEINESIPRTTNFNEFLSNSSYQKISLLHVPFPYVNSFNDIVNQCIDNSNNVIILCSELHASTVEFITKYKHPKITYFINGFINNQSTKLWPDWFITSTDFYKTNNVLTQLDPYSVKEKYFDILLGQRRTHRDIIYNGIKQLDLTPFVTMTYLTNHTIPLIAQPDWIWEPGTILPNYDFNHSVTMVNYYNYHLRLSQVIPIQIYNQTAYSLVAETNCDNHYMFPTEKIVKPILGRRLFIVFSGCHYLKHLRNLGFKTFDGIIDESYDTIYNLQTRGQLILEQIKYLVNQDQLSILKQIQSITEHNYRVMIETNWSKEFTDELSFLMQRV